MIDEAQALGITTWQDRSRFGLSLTLGGGDVKMIDMAQAYGVLANLGEKVNINPILEIDDFRGETIYKRVVEKKEVESAQNTFIINNILSDNWARTPVFGPHSLLVIPGHQVAVKTGTTNSLRDNWCIGYTPDLLVAAWVGNNDNTPMSWVASGISGATPIWNRIITQMLTGRPNSEWEEPEGVENVAICQTTGTLPCAACPQVKEEYFSRGTAPTKHCVVISVTATPTDLAVN